MLNGCMATAQEKFEKLLADDFAPWLKQRGFRRRHGSFRRRQDAAWQIVNFQRHRYAHSRMLRFTINLGVSLDVLHEDPPWRSRGWPLEYECDFRARIGSLLVGEDRWWTVRALLPTRAISDDVMAGLEMALPWLDARSDPRAVLTNAPRNPTRETSGLAALVALARKIGDEAEIEAAEAELRRYGGSA